MAESKFISVAQAAELLGVSVATVWRLVCSKKIPHVRIGRSVRIGKEKLLRELEKDGKV